MSEGSDIDLSSLTPEQVISGIGDMVLSLLQSHRAAIIISRDDGVVTFLNPLVLADVPPESLVPRLLGSWSEEQISEFLAHVYG